jgi:hypothetical protein
MSDKVSSESNDSSLEVGDWIARQFFSPTDLQMSPEEYAARNAHLWGCFSLDRYRYEDALLGAWVRHLAKILSCEEEVERCRRNFLAPEEREQVRKDQSDGF